MAPNESCIICWHPEPEFPYECTKVKSRCGVFVSFVCGVWHVYMECTQQKQCLLMHVMYNTITKAVLFFTSNEPPRVHAASLFTVNEEQGEVGL